VITEADVRRVASSLPGVTEGSSYGTPAFRVAGRLIARVRPEGEVLLVWNGDLDHKHALLAAEPAKYLTAVSPDRYPAVLLVFAAADVDELTDLLTAVWRARAPRRLVAAYDATPG
jgi:hypothetical protein